ncbi:MAG: hypothetical protein COZ34_02825 [Candidatus Pacebacteria bacterium CG_4_10_14_3_um_filter_34_15]|nr:hypothetical protein [Candidatus Pacearchaeota archaeon]NCQ65319.1 hypothetical protein [Candidatus Paceibacterota bacterium]OIO44347.1 MAG: hypothetical protein AUJ41_03065 [Candidatus Pacebacteria bacterium CG1_02_43_31]PIQ80897.1 MAG: hypothetical protein COV78_03080 [Candidatus Pacebacteria bacterium CG11_big_fil_rev_8_21_14_0_20_34_55]PIX81511.1 MAG: hypothetical protein COZ34_02825 [Candidatus Pacebacteria bacterium CG_4_10_14_3_um_filter_34_15]PJC43780.1 MAG: hypothetical protein CO0
MTASPTSLKNIPVVPKSIKKSVLVSWIAMFVIALVSTIYYFIAQPELPIFYSLAQRKDQIVQKEYLFLFPTISLLMNLLHFQIIKVLKKYSSLMLKLFVFTTAFLQIIFLLSLLRIVMITI